MANTPIVAQAARRKPPGAGTILTVGTASTTAVALTGFLDQYVMFQAKGDSIYFRFGASTIGAAVVTDVFLKDGEREEFYIDSDHQYVRAISDTAAMTLIYAAVGD